MASHVSFVIKNLLEGHAVFGTTQLIVDENPACFKTSKVKEIVLPVELIYVIITIALKYHGPKAVPSTTCVGIASSGNTSESLHFRVNNILCVCRATIATYTWQHSLLRCYMAVGSLILPSPSILDW